MAEALLIDVKNQSVGTLDVSDTNDVITAIGNGATSLNMYKLPNGDYLVYDMEAFYKTPEGGFVHSEMNWLLMGNGCVVGYDPATNTLSDCITTDVALLQSLDFKDAPYCIQAQL